MTLWNFSCDIHPLECSGRCIMISLFCERVWEDYLFKGLIFFFLIYINHIIHCKIKRRNHKAPTIVTVPGKKTNPKKIRIKIYK